MTSFMRPSRAFHAPERAPHARHCGVTRALALHSIKSASSQPTRLLVAGTGRLVTDRSAHQIEQRQLL
jgi:hypothetical protein